MPKSHLYTKHRYSVKSFVELNRVIKNYATHTINLLVPEEKYDVLKQGNILSSTNTFQNCKLWACDYEPTTSCQLLETLQQQT